MWCDCPQAAQPAQQAHPQLLVEPGGGVSDDEEEDVEAIASKAHRVSPLSYLVPAVVPAHLGCPVSVELCEPPRGYVRHPALKGHAFVMLHSCVCFASARRKPSCSRRAAASRRLRGRWLPWTAACA